MKFSTMDRYDNITFRNERFIHKDGYVSPHEDEFSIQSGRHFGTSRKARKFGVNKREPRVSGNGYNVCKHSVGLD